MITDRVHNALLELQEEMTAHLLQTDLECIEDGLKEGVFIHPDDKKAYKKNIKAFKRVISFYTTNGGWNEQD